MTVPGSNLLKIALRSIKPQVVKYSAYTGRVLNDIGLYEPAYATSVDIKGSFQPVPQALYEKYGLDAQKTYFMFYSLTNIFGVARDITGDKLEFNGKTFQCESQTDWFAIDGWESILVSMISN